MICFYFFARNKTDTLIQRVLVVQVALKRASAQQSGTAELYYPFAHDNGGLQKINSRLFCDEVKCSFACKNLCSTSAPFST